MGVPTPGLLGSALLAVKKLASPLTSTRLRRGLLSKSCSGTERWLWDQMRKVPLTRLMSVISSLTVRSWPPGQALAGRAASHAGNRREDGKHCSHVPCQRPTQPGDQGSGRPPTSAWDSKPDECGKGDLSGWRGPVPSCWRSDLIPGFPSHTPLPQPPTSSLVFRLY